MAAPVRPTLGEMTYRLSVRMGFAATGGASQVQRPILEDFLKSAQKQLIEHFQQQKIRRINDDDPGTLTTGMKLYDIPDDADPERIEEIRLLTLSGDGAYPALRRGITSYMRAYDDQRIPTNYEIRIGTTDQVQIEVWPTPNGDYPVRMEYFIRARPFFDETDRVTLDDELVFLHALTAAKSHYRHPDSESVSAQLNGMLSALRMKQHTGRRYVRRGFSASGHASPVYIPPKRV